MKICEKCNIEYEDYAEWCSECGGDLKPYEPSLEKEPVYTDEPVTAEYLYTATSNMDMEIVRSLLESNGIHTLIKRKGSGDYLNIASGINFQGTDIYVNEQDLKLASDLIKTVQDKSEDQDPPSATFKKEEAAFAKKRRDRMRMVLFVMMGIPLIISLLQSLFQMFFGD